MSAVTLSMPARTPLLPLLGPVVTGVAARQGLSVDAIDDLAIAVKEAAGYLLALRPPAGRLHLSITPSAGSVEVELRTDARAPEWPGSADRTLARKILSGLTDQASFGSHDGEPAIRLVKRASPVREA